MAITSSIAPTSPFREFKTNPGCPVVGVNMNDSPDTILGTGLAETSSPRMLYGRNEAAYQLCISTRALDYLIEKKELAVRRMGRKILIPYSELLKFSRKDHDAVATV
jgi:excisionase family DNA binding protein